MWSRRLLPVLILTAGPLVSSPTLAATACTLSATNLLAGGGTCSYDGQPPTGVLTASGTQGRTEVVWSCGDDEPIVLTLGSGTNYTVTRDRVAVETCTLTTISSRGPATFTVTAT